MARAFVLTVSDRSARGERPDETGPAVVARLARLGYQAEAAVVPDDIDAIRGAARREARAHELVVVTGGTGLGPRDVSPEAVRPLLAYEVPGLGELMRAAGLRSTPFAALSRSLAGVLGRTLVLVVPGSPRGALESLDAVADVLPHALETLTGADHAAGPGGTDVAGHPAAHPASRARAERAAPTSRGEA